MAEQERWQKVYSSWSRAQEFTPEHFELARNILEEVRSGSSVKEAVRGNPIPEGGYIGKHLLVRVYHELTEGGEWAPNPALLARIRMKPVRTLSGVTTVTVLTKPYPCPGKCIFCPTDVRMPKSYLPDEPGAMRALMHEFDPYDQTSARMAALEAVGHPTDKIELLILGGTWSSYREDYQEWFVKRCLDAMNGVESATLQEAQLRNEDSVHRNVGLVIETRPDHVDQKEIAHLRKLGVTKVQMGAQSFDDDILALNQRGHTAMETLEAVNLLRAAGFKIVLHWMPNLLGATPESDREDFTHMWEGYCPDEIKIYPNQLLENTELYGVWQQGGYRPYSTEELVDLISDIKPGIPRYCRVNRIIRDIPSTNVVDGNRRTSLRQDVQHELRRRGELCQCIRCREVRGHHTRVADLSLEDLVFHAGGAEEHFLAFNTPEDKLAGFLRLSLPGPESPKTGLKDLDGAAIIREVHVYGQSLPLGVERKGAAQHSGLGTRLLQHAERIAREHGYRQLAVISAIGTKRYYKSRGFRSGELYQLKDLN